MSLFKKTPPTPDAAKAAVKAPTKTPDKVPEKAQTKMPMPPVPPVAPDKENLMLLASRMVRLSLWMGGALALSIVAIVGLILTRPKPHYFAVTPSLRFIHLTALDKTEVPPSAVADWAVSTTMRALNFGFTNYRQVLIGVRDRFTQIAYNQLVNSLIPTIKIVKKNNLEVILTPTAAPQLVRTGELNGRYAWLYQFKCIRSYEPSGLIATQNLIAQVTVEQVPATRNAKRIVVAQLVLKQDQSAN